MTNFAPITTAAGTPFNATLHIERELCKALPASAPLSVSIASTTGAITANGTISVAPVTLLVTITYSAGRCGCTKSVQFSTDILVGVTGTATTISVTANNVSASGVNIAYGRATGVVVDGLLTISSTAVA